jgi:predicted Zn-dependent peptidase
MTSVTQSHTFQNGFSVIYQRSEHAIPITCNFLICKVGSAYETDTVRGASHFVEHMCIKGTEKIKKTHNLLLQYNKSGTFFNGYTDKWNTSYVIKCDDDALEHSIDTLGDMLLHSLFDRKDFAREQHIVVEETLRIQDNHSAILEEHLERILFSGSSYQYPIDHISYHPTAKTLTYERMIEWYHWFYQPSNFVLSIVSNRSFVSILAMLRKTAFVKKVSVHKNRPSFALPSPILTLHPISQLDQPIRIEYIHKKGITTTFLDISFRTCPHHSLDKYKLIMLEFILNGFSGKLFTALRTERGLTYHSSAHTVHLEHTGYFNIHAQTDPTKMIDGRQQEGVLSIIIHLLNNLKQHGVSEEEVTMIKGNIKGTFLLGMESIDMLAQFNGAEYILSPDGSFIPYEDRYKTFFSRITKKQIDEIIHKYFTRENMVIGIMYDKELSKKKIETICHQFS